MSRGILRKIKGKFLKCLGRSGDQSVTDIPYHITEQEMREGIRNPEMPAI